MATPKLRFKEFIKPYKNIKYEEFAPLQRGFDLPVSTIVDGEYPVVFSNGILKKHNSFKAKAPGVVTGRSGTIGNITWVDKDYWPHNTSLWVTNFFDNDPRYIFYFLQDFDVSRFASGSGVPTLNRNDVHAQLIHISTDRNEQSKIATFLSAVDEKINQLTQKHQLLSQYKQGMMQKLFSQQIRFKADDGSEFEEWKTVRVKDIFDVTRGQVLAVSQTISVSDKEYKFPVFSSQTKQNGLMGFYKKYLFEDAITWTTDGANAGEVNFRKGKFYCTNVCGVLKSEKGYANQCIAAILNRVSRKYVSYVGNPKLMNNVMSEIPITIPSNISEQTKIANFLSTIDQKIDVVSQQIEQAKQWKKGLLQQMFV